MELHSSKSVVSIMAAVLLSGYTSVPYAEVPVQAQDERSAEIDAPDVQIAPERITAYGNFYILGRRAIDDLDALETAVRAVRPKRIQLNACGADASHALKAAVHRFSDLPLQVQVLNASAPTCEVAIATQASQRSALMPTGIDDSAVARYWEEVAP